MAIGCYEPNYLPASFRGVSFTAEDTSDENGRRAAEGEFPFANRTRIADLGIKIERLSLRGRFQENSHVADAAAMRAACRAPGSGLLIHPTRGAILVLCSRCVISDEVEKGQGVTAVELDFIVDDGFGLGGFGLSGLLGVISLVAITAATRSHLQRNYSPADARFYQAPQVLASARGAIEQVRDAYSMATATTSNQEVWQTISSFNAAINDQDVIASADQYGVLLTNSLATLEGVTGGQSKYEAFKKLSNWAAKSSMLDGESRQYQNAIYSSLRVLSIGYAARGAVEKETTTLDSALVEYDAISTVLEQEAEIARDECNDPLFFLAIKDFMIAVQKTLLQRAYTLPGMVTYKFKGGTHSLVAAYEIYGDARRARDLEVRNPQYMPFAFGPEVLAAEVPNA